MVSHCLKETENSHYEEKKEEIAPAHHAKETEETEVEKEYDQSTQSSDHDSGNIRKEASKSSSTSVLGAIGETLVEIAQTTKDLVVGDGENQQRKGETSES